MNKNTAILITGTPEQTEEALKIFQEVKRKHGFFTEDDVEALAKNPDFRLFQVLVRCHECRFVCAMQDVRFLVQSVIRNEGCVRDVSMLAGTEYPFGIGNL